jgi:hypothetical protein
MDTVRLCFAVGMLGAALGLAQAQQAAAPAAASPAIPRPDELEPAVTTSPDTAPAAQTQASPSAAQPAQAAGKVPDKSAAAASTAKAPVRKGTDRVELGTTDITGNRELPKVLYIVPWKSSDLGDLTGKPVNSLVDEVLEPLDRDVFQRQNRYYEGLKGGPAAPKAGAAQSSANNP